jgi:DNA-binding CsgD family transcriptional regulator
MIDDYSRVLALIDQIYGAAANDGLWSGALRDLRLLLGAEGSTLLFTDHNLKPIDKVFEHNIAPDAVTAYNAHYHKIDIRLHRAIPGSIGKVVTDRDLVDQEIIGGHAFYQDFLRPIGYRYVIGAIMDLGDTTFALAACHFGLKQAHPDRALVDRAALLMPHLRRGLQLRRRLTEVGATEHAALEVLDRLGHAVFLINQQGRVVWQNVAADQLLNQRDGLTTADGELRAMASKTTKELTALIRSAINAVDQPRAAPGGLMTIARPSMRRAYQVLVTPLPKAPSLNLVGTILDSIAVAAVFVTDPETNKAPRAQVLAKLYHLTPAEAKLATALASGMSTKAYADQEKRSIHYVRWLLKQVEAKTDTRRIADLIRLLTSQTGFPGKIPDGK